mgnify:CR=1 FL=1
MRLSDKYPFLTNYFTQAFASSSKSFPQSILFYGNDLNSQYTLAKEIARVLNCTSENKGGDNCQCLNCKWIDENVHPAVLTISRFDNKPEDDESKSVISIKQSQMIKEMLVSSSEYYRVFIFCDKDDEGNISGLNSSNFQAETANSLLKIIEEPQPGVMFIFLTRYKDDVLSTIISRSQCFFVPSKETVCYDFSLIKNVFLNYYNFDRKDVFEISQNLQDLSANSSVIEVLLQIQNYILSLLKQNTDEVELISHVKIVEESIRQAKLGMKPANIFDDLCLKLIR